MYYYNMANAQVQDVDIITSDHMLTDKSATGRQRPWRIKKMANELLAHAYDSIDSHKAARLRDCAKFLSFRLYSNGEKKLHSMSSCRVRLCPICTWRRSLLVYHNTRKIMDWINNNEPQTYIFLTLTVRNCDGDELGDTLDNMMAGFSRLTRVQPWIRAVNGWYRGLELTHNCNVDSKDYDTYHPHFHVLLCVNTSYFNSRDYLSQSRWTELWKTACRLDYTPIVDVRRIKGTDAVAVAEVAKYSVKDADYIIPDDWDLTCKTVGLLDKVLCKRRFVAYGGLMSNVKRRLKLVDEDEANLINVGDDDVNPDDIYDIVNYWWYSGYKQYYAIEP